jgi:hypothetical protein
MASLRRAEADRFETVRQLTSPLVKGGGSASPLTLTV